MGLDNRHYYRDDSGGSRFREALRRIFGNGENPLEWAIPLYRAWGIRVKLHILFLVMIIAELILALPHGGIGGWYMAIGMGTLFGIVLLHEYGHCFACRWVGGTADQILLWPLGGLAMCQPPRQWKADFITTAGGPMVNVVLVPILGLGLMAAGVEREAIFFNPFDPGRALALLQTSSTTTTYLLVWLWWAHYTNLALLAFNVLIPAYPMDGGRLLQALLWSKLGYRKSMEISLKVGLVAAGCLFVFAMVGNQSRLLSLAIFVGITCWIEKKRLDMTSDAVGFGYPGAGGGRGFDESWIDHDQERREAEDRVRRREEAEREQAELDRILVKIRSEGMGALSKKEKAWLEAHSRQRQGQ